MSSPSAADSWEVLEPEAEAAIEGDCALALALQEVEYLKERLALSEGRVAVLREEVRALTAPSQQEVVGPLAVPASVNGKRFYLFTAGQPGGLSVVAGAAYAVQLLGGRWVGHGYGRSPSGFPSLAEAVTALAVLPNRAWLELLV